MNDNGASEDETYRRCALRLRRSLLFLSRHADIIPEVYLTFFHIDQLAQFGKVLVQMRARKRLRIATVQVEN